MSALPRLVMHWCKTNKQGRDKPACAAGSRFVTSELTSVTCSRCIKLIEKEGWILPPSPITSTKEGA